MKEVLLNNIYRFLYMTYNSLNENVDTDGDVISVDIKGKRFIITIEDKGESK